MNSGSLRQSEGVQPMHSHAAFYWYYYTLNTFEIVVNAKNTILQSQITISMRNSENALGKIILLTHNSDTETVP